MYRNLAGIFEVFERCTLSPMLRPSVAKKHLQRNRHYARVSQMVYLNLQWFPNSFGWGRKLQVIPSESADLVLPASPPGFQEMQTVSVLQTLLFYPDGL